MKKFDNIIYLLVFVIFLTLIVDIFDAYYYNKFLRNNGVSFFSGVQPKLILKYITTYPGNFLTLFGVGPWVILLGYIYIDDIKEKINYK